MEELTEHTLLIVTGACLKGERLDRPLAYRVQQAADRRMIGVVTYQSVVLSDVWYLNSEQLQQLPVISIGGPGVNHLSGFLYDKLPNALVVDHVFQIQMDVTLQDHRCAVWGMDHEDTIEAVDTFLQKGYLDQFMQIFPQAIA